MSTVRVPITVSDGAALPEYATSQSAGMDLRAAEDVVLEPGAIKSVRTGLRIALPEGYEAQVRPRSGLALRYGISIPNAPGTIDADYRGEICVLLINHGKAPFEIRRGDRIAQMVVAPVTRVVWESVAELPETERGAGGFGSTGVRDEVVR